MRKLLFLGLVLGFPGILSAQLQDDLISDPLVAELAERAEIISYDDRDVVKVSLEDILLLTISRSLSLGFTVIRGYCQPGTEVCASALH